MILALGPFFNAAKSPRHFLGRSQELMLNFHARSNIR